MIYLLPDEKFDMFQNRKNEAKSHFKNFHAFGCPFVLNDRLQDSITQPKWLPRSIVGVYIGISQEYVSNISYVFNLKRDTLVISVIWYMMMILPQLMQQMM